jgi:hypothetical protein
MSGSVGRHIDRSNLIKTPARSRRDATSRCEHPTPLPSSIYTVLSQQRTAMSLAQRIPFSFMPFRPSPLSTHDSNAYQPANFAPPSGTGLCEPRAPKRGSKYSTLVKDKVKERDRQHDVFLKKVRQASEDRRWNVRGEQVGISRRVRFAVWRGLLIRVWLQNLRLDFITRRREWEEEQRRRAEVEVAPIVEDGDMDDESANADSQGQGLSPYFPPEPTC